MAIVIDKSHATTRIDPHYETVDFCPVVEASSPVDGSYIFYPETPEIIAMMSKFSLQSYPSVQAIAGMDALIKRLRNDPVTGTDLLATCIDGLYIAGFDPLSSLVNLKTVATVPGQFDLVGAHNVGAPAGPGFSAGKGFMGDGVGAYVTNNFDILVDATPGRLCTLNSLHQSMYNSNPLANTGRAFGDTHASSNFRWQYNNVSATYNDLVRPWTASDLTTPRQVGGVNVTDATLNNAAANCIVRRASNNLSLYINETPRFDANTTATITPTGTGVMSWLGDGSTLTSSARMGWATFGPALSTNQWLGIYRACMAYMDVLQQNPYTVY